MKTSRFTTERSGAAPCCSAQVLPPSVVAMMEPTRVPLLLTAQPVSALGERVLRVFPPSLVVTVIAL